MSTPIYNRFLTKATGTDFLRIKTELNQTKMNSPTLNNLLLADFSDIIPKQHHGRTPNMFKSLTMKMFNIGTQSNIQTWSPKVKSLVELIYDNVVSKRNVLADLRKILRTRFPNSSRFLADTKKMLSITYEEHKAVEARSKENLEVRSSNKIPFNQEHVLTLIRQLNTSTKLEDMIIEMALTTGSRFIEILRTSTYHAVRNKPHDIAITGLAKKKDGGDITITKPIVVIDSHSVLERIHKIREMVETPENREKTDAKLTQLFNSRVNKHIKKLGLPTTIHRLREIYAQLSYNLYANKQQISNNRWTQSVLGHNDIRTSIHYNTVSLDSKGHDLESRVDNVESETKENTHRIDDVAEEVHATPQNPNRVEFIDSTGKKVFMDKLPRLRDTDRIPRAQNQVKEMHRLKIPITTTNIRKVGIGGNTSKLIMDWWRTGNSSVLEQSRR